MDSFATSRFFLHAVFSLDRPVTSADRLQLTAWVLFHLEGETSALNGAGRDTCRRWEGLAEPGALRSSENRRSGRLKRLNSETQLHSPETDWPLPPWVTDIPVNPRAAYLFAYLKPVGDPESGPDFTSIHRIHQTQEEMSFHAAINGKLGKKGANKKRSKAKTMDWWANLASRHHFFQPHEFYLTGLNS